MIFFTHGKHIDLSKIVAISDLETGSLDDYLTFNITFQLMDKPMVFTIDRIGVYRTEPEYIYDGFGSFKSDPWSPEEKENGLADLKKFKQDYNRLLNAWIKLNEISKSKNS